MSKGKENGLIINQDTLPVIESMAEGLPGGFFIYHADGGEEFIYVNSQMVKIMGCRTEEEFRELTGNSFRGLVHPDDLESVEAGIVEQIDSDPNRIDRVKYRVIRADGTLIWIDETGHFVHTEAYGDIFYVSVLDVTDEHSHAAKKRMENQLKVVDALCRGYLNVYLINTKEKSVKAIKLDKCGIPGLAHRMDALYDYDTLWSRYIQSQVHPEDAAMMAGAVSIRNLKHAMDTDGEFVVTYRVLEDGVTHYYQVKFTSLGEATERKDSVIVCFQNMDAVVEKKLADAKALEDAKRGLEDALAIADLANKAKTDFFFNLSHDIRTPMNVIIGFTDLLSKYESDAERRRDYIRKIQESSRYLLELINNVLDMARIESGKMSLEESVWQFGLLQEFLQSVFSGQLKRKRLSFVCETDIHSAHVVCDVTKVKEIFFNLVSNAVKYTPEGGSVALRITELASEQEGSVLFQTVVEDTGIGMSKEFLPHLFEDFTRERSEGQSRIVGTGLGMTIVRKMVDLMKGTIEVESEVGKGTRITVVLPCRIAGSAELEQQSAVTQENDGAAFFGKRILLAEDNELNAEIAVEILDELGFMVDHAMNGRRCVDMLQRAAERYYDLILMDVQMPVMNGYEAAREVRSLPGSRGRIPIIAMTANAFEEDKRNALASGMNGHIAKPIELPKLVEALETVFQ